MSVAMIHLHPRNATIPIASKTIRNEWIQHAKRCLTNEKEKRAVINFMKGKSVTKLDEEIAANFLFTTVLAMWMQTTPAFAQSTKTVADPNLPREVDDILWQIQLICLGICVGAAVVMAMIAGFFRILGLREEAKRRYTDAIAGMMMVLTAPAVLGLIATVVRGLLKLFPHYGA